LALSEVVDNPFLDYERSIFPHLKRLDEPSLGELYKKIDHIREMRWVIKSGAMIAAGAALRCCFQPLAACSFAVIAVALSVASTYFQKPPPYLILSIDGGGIRGILPIQILALIEEELGCRIGEVFDCVTGTSIGGILALFLIQPDPQNPSKPKRSANDALQFLEKEGPKVFDRSTFQSIQTMEGLRAPKYSNENLRKILKHEFKDTKLDEVVVDVLIPSYDLNSSRPAIFHHFRDQPTQKPFLMRDVGMGTSAAPTYFPPHKVEDLNLIDGAISANNPALLAYMKASGHIDPNRDIFILSLGTGQMVAKAITAEESRKFGIIQWLPILFDLIFQSTQEMLTLQLKLLKNIGEVPLSLVRIQPQLNKASQEELDNASPDNIKSLRCIAIKYFENNIGFFHRELIEPLKKYRIGVVAEG
jgi:uncharacterized protein